MEAEIVTQIGVHVPHAADAGGQAGLGMAGQYSKQFLEEAGHDLVVGASEVNKLAGGQVYAAVERRRHVEIDRVAIHLDGGILAGQTFQNLEAVVGGSVINDDDFAGLDGLGGHGAQAGGQELRVIVIGDD